MSDSQIKDQEGAEPISVTVTGDMENSGTLYINNTDTSADSVAGNTYTQNGNWHGNDGIVVMKFLPGSDSTVADRLNIKGDATGSTNVVLTAKLGGRGEATINGIKLIQVDGVSSSGAFKSNTVAAGVYDYTLQKGSQTGQDIESWYLTNKLESGNPDTQIKNYRPESGAYTANLVAANTLFNSTLHDRQGETGYINTQKEPKQMTRVWMRNVGGQNKTKSNRYVLQIGGDIAQWSNTGTDQINLGLMVGYARQNGTTENQYSGRKAKSHISGYSTGIYGTYFQNEKEQNGLYIDSWLQYSWFNNEVMGDQLADEKYHSNGLTASLESGYTIPVGSADIQRDNLFNQFYIQPKAQVIWMGVKANEHREDNGTLVKGVGNNNLQSRLGVRAVMNAKSKDKDAILQFQPFIEVNWVHNTKDFGVRMDGQTVLSHGSRNVAEVKTGLDGKISQNMNIWANVSYQSGSKGYKDTQGMLGVKYTF